MDQVSRDKLGVEVRINEEQIRLRPLDDLSDLVEIVKDVSLADRCGQGTDRLKKQLVSGLLKGG